MVYYNDIEKQLPQFTKMQQFEDKSDLHRKVGGSAGCMVRGYEENYHRHHTIHQSNKSFSLFTSYLLISNFFML